MHYLVTNNLNLVKFTPYIFLVSIVIFLGIGWLYGKYRLKTSGDVIIRDALATAIFGLSALVLGFTFSGANEHFDKRVELMRSQADSIRQVYQSSRYLNTTDQLAVRKSLQAITADRLVMYQDIKTIADLNTNLDRLTAQANQLNELIITSIPRAPANSRELAEKVLRPQQDQLMDSITAGALNARHHPPPIIDRFLFVLLSLGALLSGYAMAVQKEEDWFLTILYLAVMGFALYVIFALEYPNQIFDYEIFNADLLRTQKLIQ
jgi:hypothetical protein